MTELRHLLTIKLRESNEEFIKLSAHIERQFFPQIRKPFSVTRHSLFFSGRKNIMEAKTYCEMCVLTLFFFFDKLESTGV